MECEKFEVPKAPKLRPMADPTPKTIELGCWMNIPPSTLQTKIDVSINQEDKQKLYGS